MKLKSLRGYAAAVVALLMGIPMAAPAQAGDSGSVSGGVFSIIAGIIDIAGNS